MHRARKRSVTPMLAAEAVAAFLVWASPARAFHAGNVFDKPAGAGGGAGIFYTGAAAERGWDCTACHTNPAGKIRVTLASEPEALLQTFRYEPGTTYSFRATLDGEHLGAGASNFNSLAIAIVDAQGGPAGEMSGYAADEIYGGRTTIASMGQRPGQTSWSFKWTAPAAKDVAVKLHVAAVDGNGAGGAGGGTLTDPWGDDVFIGKLSFSAEGATSTVGANAARNEGAPIGMLGFAIVFGLRRQRGGRR